MNKRWGVLLILGSLALMLVGCGQSSHQTRPSKTVTLTAKTELATMDISKASDSTSLTQLYQTQEGLYRLGKDERIENAMAVKTQVNPAGTVYTFNLRRNNHWNNGAVVTAKDFVYSWRRTVDPKTAAGYAYLMSGIKNFQAIQKKTLSPSALGVKALSPTRLQVTLTKPVAYFKLLLAFPTFFPQQQSAVTRFGSQNGHDSQHTAYDGAFQMTGWSGTNDTWQLKKNPQFWNQQAVKLNQLNFQVVKDSNTSLNLYQKQKLDAAPLDGTQVANLKNNPAMKTFVGGSMFYLEMNQKASPALANQKVRQALSLAINRQTLTKQVLRDGSSVPLGFVSQNLFHNPQTHADFAKDAEVTQGVTTHLAEAKTLMQAGLKASGTSRLTLNLVADDTDQAKSITEFLQGQLQKLPHVTVTLNNMPYKSRLNAETTGHFDLVLNSWGADFADPINFLDLMTQGNPNNHGDYHDATYDQLIDHSENRDANRPEARYADLVAAEKRLMQTQGVIPLFQPATVEMWNPQVRNYVWNPAGMSRGYVYMYRVN